MRVFGIDPGSLITGYGLVAKEGSRLQHIENGCIRPAAGLALPERLAQIHQGLYDLMTRFRPDVVAIEEVFFAKNVASALKLGQSRGVALLAAATLKLPVYEYAATQIKQALTGYGRASKDQVQKMVQKILGLPQPAEENASDAMAIAICHLHTDRALLGKG